MTKEEKAPKNCSMSHPEQTQVIEEECQKCVFRL